MKSYQQLFAELKRRNVFKVSAVYGAVAFALIQLTDPLGTYLRLPESFGPFVVALLLLGFPVALVLAWAFDLSPQGVRKVGPAAPGEIEAIVAEPASKRWPAGLLALAGVALLVGGAWWTGVRAGRSDSYAGAAAARPDSLRLSFVDADADPRPSISVLPFADMSPEGDQDYFSDGITEELYNTLGKIRELRVTGRTSAFAFKGQGLDLRAVGDSLDVEYLVEGSVRKAGDQLRITAQLIDTKDGSHLWSEQYDREMIHIFAIQTEIAEAIARELRIPLGLDDGERLVTPTADLEAYDLYLAGRARMRERGQSVFEAARLFEAAVARDSAWAPAWAGLAESRALLPFYAPGPDDPQVSPDSAYWARSLDAAELAARRALALDPDNASATVALANVLRDRWNWNGAEAGYVRALTLDPDNVEAHQQYAEFLAYVGRADEALRSARRALALDRSPIRLNVAGYVAVEAARFEEAIRYMTEGIALDPEGRVPWMRGNLLAAYIADDRWLQAREQALNLIREVVPELEDEVLRTWPAENRPPTEFNPDVLTGDPILRESAGTLWMAIGKPERAIDSLERLFLDAHPFGYSNLLFNPEYDPLRDDPRFQELMKIRGLEGRRPVRSSADGSDTP
jgi:TolB-like protein